MLQVGPEGSSMGEAGRPAGIGHFLASDAAAYINGAIIPVDGGYLGK